MFGWKIKKKKTKWEQIKEKKAAFWSFIFLISVCCLYFGVLYVQQDSLIYHPDDYYRSPQMSGFYNFKENPLKMADGTRVMTWYAPGDKSKPALLFFHGNSQQIATFAPQLNAFAQAGYPVLMMEYRGFGSTKGHLTQQNVFQDAVEAFDFLKSQGYSKIVAYGYSFGCAVAVGLTQYRNPDGVVLMAPFASMSKIVDDKAPFASIILKNSFPSDKYIRTIHCPLLIMHGKDDPLIPYKHSEILYKAAVTPNKKLLLLDGVTHHTIFFEPENLSLIMDWLNKMEF